MIALFWFLYLLPTAITLYMGKAAGDNWPRSLLQAMLWPALFWYIGWLIIAEWLED